MSRLECVDKNGTKEKQKMDTEPALVARTQTQASSSDGSNWLATLVGCGTQPAFLPKDEPVAPGSDRSSTQEVVSKEGYLNLKGNSVFKVKVPVTIWKRRWAVLEEGCLLLYSSRSADTKPRKRIPLDSTCMVREIDAVAFEVATSTRRYVFRAEVFEECNDWVRALKRAIETELAAWKTMVRNRGSSDMMYADNVAESEKPQLPEESEGTGLPVRFNRYNLSLSSPHPHRQGAFPSLSPQSSRRNDQRVSEWAPKVEVWEEKGILRDRDNIRVLLRQGVPDELRGRVWKVLMGTDKLRARHSPKMYESLLEKEPEYYIHECIKKDVPRTYPQLEIYMDQSGPGQQSLYRILRAYASFDPQVGYSQGMAFIVGVPLLYMEEEDAFWFLVEVMRRFRLRNLFESNRPLLHLFTYQINMLLQRRYPELMDLFNKHSIDTTFFVPQWFCTLFTYKFPVEFVARIWDVMFLDGIKVMFQTSIGLLVANQDKLLALDNFEAVCMYLTQIPENEAALDNRMLQFCFSIDVTDTELSDIEGKFHKRMSKDKSHSIGDLMDVAPKGKFKKWRRKQTAT